MPVLGATTTPDSSATLLLVLGGLAAYVASRAAADALARRLGRDPSGRLALGHWGPIAVVALVAVGRGRPDLALGVVFGTAVAAMSLVLGIVAFLAPPDALPGTRRAWPFALAAALLVLIAGFRGALTLTHALMLAVLGCAVLNVWRGAATDLSVAEVLGEITRETDRAEPPPLPTGTGDGPQPVLQYARTDLRSETGLRVAQVVLALALAAAGAVGMVTGATLLDASSRLFRAALVAAGMVSPLLVLPLLSTATDLAQRGRAGQAASTLLGVVLLNLCALLPILIVVWYARSALTGGAWPPTTTRALADAMAPLPLPLTVWRIDTVLVAVLGFALIPIAAGRWALGRLEGTGLLLLYAAYLAATATASVRL